MPQSAPETRLRLVTVIAPQCVYADGLTLVLASLGHSKHPCFFITAELVWLLKDKNESIRKNAVVAKRFFTFFRSFSGPSQASSISFILS